VIRLGDVKTLTSPNTPRLERPEWIDANTATRIFSLSRATLYRLVEDGRIRSSSLRTRGQLKGRRLFSYDSIAALIERSATGGEGGAE
jgi:hypothetical protein